jgi:hypothetical protein
MGLADAFVAGLAAATDNIAGLKSGFGQVSRMTTRRRNRSNPNNSPRPHCGARALL